MPNELDALSRKALLNIARQAVTAAVNGQRLPKLDLDSLPSALSQPGASFVTLTEHSRLRGCIGTLEAYQPLAKDVQQRAVQAAMEDPRFSPVTPKELPQIEVEVSRLTAPIPLVYEKAEDLPNLLRPNVDGVILQHGRQRATFLPQVWEDLPQPEDFLTHLCRKMGAPGDIWRREVLHVETYQVEVINEEPEP